MLHRTLIITLLCLNVPLSIANATPPDVSVPSQIPKQNTLVPDDDKAYNCVDELQKSGIVIGPPDGGTFSRLRMTRDEFGVAIARILLLLPPVTPETLPSDDLKAIRNDFHQKLAQSPTAVDAFLTLIHEFAPELLQLSFPADAAVLNIPAAEAALMDIHAEGQSEGAANPSFAALLPADHWAYQAIDTLQRAGIVEYHIRGDLPYTGSRRLMNRYEFFVTLERIRPMLQPVGTKPEASNAFYLPELLRSGNQKEIDAERSDVQHKLKSSIQALDALQALICEFYPMARRISSQNGAGSERTNVHNLAVHHPGDRATEMETEVERMQAAVVATQTHHGRYIGSAGGIDRGFSSHRPFPDVPMDHWAYQAVEAVRKAGIVVGYPGRDFRTDDTEKRMPQ
jgi:hypothetical protein